MEILRLLQNLKSTFRFNGDEASLLEIWQAGLSGLTDAQVQKAEQKLYQERTSGFMPTPGEFRAYALVEQYRHAGSSSKPQWWIATDAEGHAIAWCEGLKDSHGNAIARDASLTWTCLRPTRQGLPVNQILNACGMDLCNGHGKMDLRRDHLPGPRLRIRCDICGIATEYFETARQAITRWNG